jgi:hypothetical protein
MNVSILFNLSDISIFSLIPPFISPRFTLHSECIALLPSHMYPSVATVSCSSYQSALAVLSQKVAREVWQWRAAVPRGAGYFLPSPQWDSISPLIGTVCVARDGKRARDGEWDMVSEDEYFDAIKHIDEASAQERALSSFNELTLLARAQKRAKTRAERGGCSAFEMYESYPYDNSDLGSYNPAHTVRYISSGTATPERKDGSAVLSIEQVQDRMTSSAESQGTATCNEEVYSGSIEALQQGLLTDLQIEFSQRIRQASAKKNVKHGQATPLAAHLPPVR